MAARQTGPDARRARRPRVDELIDKLREGIAQRAVSDAGSLYESDIDELADELKDMRRHLRDRLSAPKPNGLGSRQDAEVLETSLFPTDHDAARKALELWLKELKQMRLNHTAETAIKVHFLIQKAREVLPEIEAARAREAAFQARVAEAKAAGRLRELSWNEVCGLIRKAGHEPRSWGVPDALYRQARALGVINELEYEVAARRNRRGRHDAGD